MLVCEDIRENGFSMVEHIPVVPRDEIKLPRHQNGQKIDSQLEARLLIDAAALTLPVGPVQFASAGHGKKSKMPSITS